MDELQDKLKRLFMYEIDCILVPRATASSYKVVRTYPSMEHPPFFVENTPGESLADILVPDHRPGSIQEQALELEILLHAVTERLLSRM
jgi:hypothetical protein